ncbi:glucosamine inositolphosphorylceramide transferase family protein [Pedobacter sp.]|uniref:glucosamine inositolphosphorylceramide transferase family protein n=1 Tax=Pedobacter sp. TaxID=1411316 RepID=UPI003BAAA00D
MQHFISKVFNKLFTADKWNIGYVYQSVESLIAHKQLNADIKWFKEDTVDYAADPFVVDVAGKTRVYYEELNFWKGKGELMMVDDLSFGNKKKVTGVIPEAIHLSYPYMINTVHGLYCIPETSEAMEVALYKVDVDNPEKLVKKKVLLKGKAFVDSSIVFFQNKYWLFTSVPGENTHLYVYHSDTLDGDYKGHQLNPIRVKKEHCRAAGKLFMFQSELYRATQNPTHKYGGSIIINKIELLNESSFHASPLFEIMPHKKYSEGLHNISFTETMIVVDGKRKIISPFMPFKKLIRKIKQNT